MLITKMRVMMMTNNYNEDDGAHYNCNDDMIDNDPDGR